LLGTAPWGIYACLPDVTARVQISQTFPFHVASDQILEVETEAINIQQKMFRIIIQLDSWTKVRSFLKYHMDTKWIMKRDPLNTSILISNNKVSEQWISIH